jgi:hypothetical protein
MFRRHHHQLASALLSLALTCIIAHGRAAAQAPISGAPVAVGDWTWIPLPETKCRNGQPTGIGINLGQREDKILIYAQGGGACFNPLSCGLNVSSFDLAKFETLVQGSLVAGERLSDGVLDEASFFNPVRDYTKVFIPYCTGDFHAGANEAGDVGLTNLQSFVGARNMDVILRYVAHRFASGLRSAGAHVVFAGESAGGTGVSLNLPRLMEVLQAIASSARVTLVNDSGGLMGAPQCLRDLMRSRWNYDATIFDRCPTCEDFAEYDEHTLALYPEVDRVYLSSTNDTVARLAAGLFASADGCVVPLPNEAQFTAQLLEVRQRMQQATIDHGVNTATYFIDGSSQHTWITFPRFYEPWQSWVWLPVWFDDAVNDGVYRHVGP